jgi:hypothetical protein
MYITNVSLIMGIGTPNVVVFDLDDGSQVSFSMGQNKQLNGNIVQTPQSIMHFLTPNDMDGQELTLNELNMTVDRFIPHFDHG